MPSTRRLLVTGASGKTGAATVRLLLDRGHAVTALVRREDARSETLAELGADVIAGDLTRFADVATAIRGADGVYLCYPVATGLLDATATVAQAAAEANVGTVVNMSQVSARRDAASDAARQHWLAERLLDLGPFQVTHLRPTFFADWLVWGWRSNEEGGILALPFGTGRHAPITVADQARVIAAILEHPQPHDRQVYPLFGPVEMNHHEIADVMTRVLRIPVRYRPVDPDTFRSGLVDRGLPAHLVQHFGNVAADYRNGVFAGTNDLVERLTGRPATGVAQFVVDNRDAFHGIGRFAVAPANA